MYSPDLTMAVFVKEMRKKFGLTQVDLADKAGVGLRFVRELEQGKRLFGHQAGPVEVSKAGK